MYCTTYPYPTPSIPFLHPSLSSLGTFGDLQVSFSVQPADIATLATADGAHILDFFSSPVQDTALPSSALLSEPVIVPSTPGGVLNECARLCLSDEACLSFSSDGVTFCQLYLSLMATTGSITQAGASYYEKDSESVRHQISLLHKCPQLLTVTI